MLELSLLVMRAILKLNEHCFTKFRKISSADLIIFVLLYTILVSLAFSQEEDKELVCGFGSF
jgi:hypothetical protein